MKNITHVLSTLLLVCCALQAKAEGYKASKVTMSAVRNNIAMTLLGETADSFQIWVCQNKVPTNVANAAWRIDDNDSISASTAEFLANTKYALSDNYDGSQARNLSTNTKYIHFLKLNGKTSADFFSWNMEAIPDFASEFHLGGSVSISVADKYYGGNDTCMIFNVQYNCKNITQDVIGHAELDLSYDNGTTWQCYNNNIIPDITLTNATLPVFVPLGHDSVCYRFTVYPKDCYKAVYNQAAWTYVSPNFGFNDDTAPTHVKEVIMTAADGYSDDQKEHISMGKLGLTEEGYEIWSCKTTKANNALWTMDGVKLYGLIYLCTLSNNIYTVCHSDYIIGGHKPSIQQTDVHFLKPTGTDKAEYFSWNLDKSFHPYSCYIKGSFKIGTNSVFKINKSTGCIEHPFSWTFKEACRRIVKNVVTEMTLDGGKTWQEVSTYTPASDNDDNTSLPWAGTTSIKTKGDTVRYRVTVYPKDDYAVVVENGYWRAESQEFPITVDGADCTIKTTALTRSAEGKGYTTDVTWSAYSKLSDIFGGATIQYSTDKGRTWITTDSVTATSGTKSVTLPVGYIHYLLRVAPYPCETFAQLSALRPTAVSDTLTTECKPAVTTLTVQPETGELAYGQFRKVALNYALNDDLLQTCGKAFISYSYDNGSTWHLLKGFVPDATGTQTVMVDTTKQCKFRMKVDTMIDGTNTQVATETENISIH